MAAPILIDLRHLQQPAHRNRGIANHTRHILLQARHVSPYAAAAPLIGLADPALPPLPPDIAAALDDIRPNAYLPDAPPGTIFLNPSPMTTDPLFTARLLLQPGIRKAAIVYDFIPHENQQTYLPAAAARLAYLTQLVWLRRYDLYLPVSAATQAGLGSLIPQAAATVTGAALAAAFTPPARPPPPRHILLIGGDDRRKNPECAIRAHAGSPALQTARLPLVITGIYPADRHTAWRDLAQSLGGDPDLLCLPGEIAQTALPDLYRAAYAVIAASRVEGFSLPVIEAMACGVPAIASNIPPHAELVHDTALRFDPDDDATLRQIIERLVAGPDHRSAVVAAQSEVWPAYTGPQVAARLWEAVTAQPGPAIAAQRKPRLAFLSPMPPTGSGVADYSAACVAALRAHAEVTVFTPATVSALPHISSGFDRVISVMGNDPHWHGAIYTNLRRYGGACICHDSRLLHFYESLTGSAYSAQMAAAELGEPVSPATLQSWLSDETQRGASFLGELAHSATPLLVHAAATAALVRQRFGKPAVHLPFAIYRPWTTAALTPARRLVARQQLGWQDHDLHIVSFGFIGAGKGLAQGLAALAILKARNIDATMHWLGKTLEPLAPWLALAQQLGLADRVILHDRFVDEATYRRYLLAADFGLQLRLTGPGSISGALQDCIAAGLPTVADTGLAEELDAPAYIHRTPSTDPAHIAEGFATLIAENLHRQRNLAACAAYSERHSMENYAANLLAALELG